LTLTRFVAVAKLESVKIVDKLFDWDVECTNEAHFSKQLVGDLQYSNNKQPIQPK